MTTVDQLIKEALLEKDKVALNAYKNIKAEFEQFKYAQKLPRRIDEETALRIISSYAKKLEDSIKQFSEARRDDLVSEYTSELEVVKKLLPEPVNELQIYSAINEWENLNGYFPADSTVIHRIDSVAFPIPKKEMGNVIKYVKSKLPTADGKMISDIVKKYIV